MNDPLIFLLIFLTVDLAVLGVVLFVKLRREYRRKQVRHFGDRAEELVTEYIGTMFPDGVLLNNLFLKSRRGITQIDHVLLCKWGVFVIETKSHNGIIRTGKREWVQIYGEKVVRFHSPLLQNEIHCKAVEAVLDKVGADAVPVRGIVVFTSKKVTLPKNQPGVLRLKDLARFVKNGGDLSRGNTAVTAKPGKRYLSRQTVRLLGNILARHSVKGRRRRRLHEKTLRRMDRNVTV